MTQLQEWKSSVVNKLTGGVNMLLKANGVEQMMGTAKLVAADTVSVSTPDGEKTITVDAIVIATGSTPIEIPGFSFSDEHIIDSTGALDLSEIPKHLAVIGGGYIGLEMSGVFARLGSEVTVVEMQDQLLPGFDPDVVKVVARRAKKDGVKAMLKTRALGWKKAKGGVALTVQDDKDKETVLKCDKVLVTVGRRPNSANLGLEDLGVEMDGPFIKVDKSLRTNVAGVYAIGDVAGQPMLAHKATHEGEVVAEIIAGHQVDLDYKAVPAVVFTEPEIAHVGLTEPEESGWPRLLGR